MRILAIHNYYRYRGGEDESYEVDSRLLREQGHDVDSYEEHSVSIASNAPMGAALRAIWSLKSHSIVRQRLADKAYDVVHVQNFFPLVSPSVYYAARSAGVPVVQTLRNYRLTCPSAILYRDGHICEDCVGRSIAWPGAVHACYRGSALASATVALMLAVHDALGTWQRKVTLFVALTQFARRKFIAGGLPAERIVVKPNCVYPDPGPGRGDGGYALFVGRLSREKGVHTLLEAWRRAGRRWPLRIVGEGPAEQDVRSIARSLPLVEPLGRRSLAEVYGLMRSAAFLVFPSEWYETFGRVAIEAFACGTPVLASDIGAMAEIVEHRRTGLLFRAGSADDLAAQAGWLFANAPAMTEMRAEARREFEAKYTAVRNYRMLMEIYAGARRMAGSD